MRKLLIGAILALAAVGLTASTATADPAATVTFRLAQCELTVESTKDISNFSRNGLKIEGFPDETTTLVVSVAEGDVIAVKAGITTAGFTVTGCLADNGDGFD